MLSHFPANDLDRPATEGMLRATEATLSAEVHQMGTRTVVWMVALQATSAGIVIAAVRPG